MRSHILFGLSLAGAVIATCLPARGQNIVQDPGFESPFLIDGSYAIDAPSFFPDGVWQVTQGEVAFVQTPDFAAHSGVQCVELTTSGGESTLQQVLTTQAGSQYDISFFYASGFGPITVGFGGSSMSLASGNTSGHWVEASYTGLSAPGNSTALSLTTSDSDVYIDDVSVTQVVPEPASLGLMALVGVGAMARRRRESASPAV